MASRELKNVVWLDAFDQVHDPNLTASMTREEQAEVARLGRIVKGKLDARKSLAKQKLRAWRVQKLHQVAADLAAHAANNQVNSHLGALPQHAIRQSASSTTAAAPTQPSPDDIRTDLTEGKGRPRWILTAYGPGKNPPASLLESNEYSPEEIRARFYELASNGKQEEADQEAIGLWNKAQQAIDNVRNDADKIKMFWDDASKKEPNRYSICTMDGRQTREQLYGLRSSPTTFGTQSTSTPFSNPPTSTFGAPSISNPFSTPSTSPFGAQQASSNPFSKPAASAFSSQSASAFGKPGFGTAGTSTFGQSAFGQSAFGKPSVSAGFSQPAFGSTGFGGQSQNNPLAPPSASTGFGAQASTPTSIFGAPAQKSSSFSQEISPFAQAAPSNSAFSQPATSQQPNTSTFGFSDQPPASGGFGSGMFNSSSPTGTGMFGKENTTSNNPFGVKATPGAFGSGGTGPGIFGSNSGTTPVNPFGVKASSPLTKEADMDTTASQPISRDNPFAKPPTAPSGFITNSPQPSPTAIVNSTSAPPAPGAPSEPPHKVALTYAQSLPSLPTETGASGKLTSYRGQRVVYVKEPPTYVAGAEQPPTYYPCFERPDGKGLEKIWFPQGNKDATVVALEKRKKDFEAPDEEYTKEVEESYRELHLTGRWKGNVMPRVAPRREWVDCEF